MPKFGLSYTSNKTKKSIEGSAGLAAVILLSVFIVFVANNSFQLGDFVLGLKETVTQIATLLMFTFITVVVIALFFVIFKIIDKSNK